MPHAHLLVVDDEPSILTTLQKALSLEGYAVDVAGGVKIAEERLKKRTYDLCLFDVALPDGDGLSILRSMRANKLETPVIMMSGHATIDVAVQATRLGALSFLEKPLNTDALLINVETALRLDRAEAEAKELRARAGDGGLVGDSPAIKKLMEQIARAAKTQATVLVTGERGTGKELVARAIQPVIDAYVQSGFDFLAMKLVPGASVQSMRPVRVTTQGASPVLPLRMVAAGTGASVGITL